MAEQPDPKVSRRYRELGDEEPPRELDQAILAAAHRAADRPHAPLIAPAGRHRWYFAFGAAAVLVLAVAITVQVEQRPDAEALLPPTVAVPPDRVDRFDTPAEKENKAQAEPSKPLADAGPPPVRERRKAPAQQAAEVARADRLEAPPQQAPAVETQSAPAAAPAAPPSAPSAKTESRDSTSGAATGPFSDQAAPPPMATARPQAKVQESRAVASLAGPLTPEQLLERIAELRKEGRHDEADKALEEFRKQYPSYRISEEMLKKVERPK